MEVWTWKNRFSSSASLRRQAGRSFLRSDFNARWLTRLRAPDRTFRNCCVAKSADQCFWTYSKNADWPIISKIWPWEMFGRAVLWCTCITRLYETSGLAWGMQPATQIPDCSVHLTLLFYLSRFKTCSHILKGKFWPADTAFLELHPLAMYIQTTHSNLSVFGQVCLVDGWYLSVLSQNEQMVCHKFELN